MYFPPITSLCEMYCAYLSRKKMKVWVCVSFFFFFLAVRTVFIDLILIGPTFCPTVVLEVCFVMALKMDCPH